MYNKQDKKEEKQDTFLQAINVSFDIPQWAATKQTQ